MRGVCAAGLALGPSSRWLRVQVPSMEHEPHREGHRSWYRTIAPIARYGPPRQSEMRRNLFYCHRHRPTGRPEFSAAHLGQCQVFEPSGADQRSISPDDRCPVLSGANCTKHGVAGSHGPLHETHEQRSQVDDVPRTVAPLDPDTPCIDRRGTGDPLSHGLSLRLVAGHLGETRCEQVRGPARRHSRPLAPESDASASGIGW